MHSCNSTYFQIMYWILSYTSHLYLYTSYLQDLSCFGYPVFNSVATTFYHPRPNFLSTEKRTVINMHATSEFQKTKIS